MGEIEFERFRCMKCRHVWWSVPGEHSMIGPDGNTIRLGHCERDNHGRRIDWDSFSHGCYKCRSVYFGWESYPEFEARRRLWGGLEAESRYVETRRQLGVAEVERALRL